MNNHMNKFLCLPLLTAAFAITGCVSSPPTPPVSASNPANPRASEAASPVPQRVLMTGENYAMAPQAEAQPMEMEMKHEAPAHQHGEQKPAPHQHEHHQ